MLSIPSLWSSFIKNQLSTSEINQLTSTLSTTEPTRAVRFNARKLSFLNISSEELGLPFSTPVPWCSNAFYLSQKPALAYNPYFFSGLFYTQEPSSMLLWQVLTKLPIKPNSGLSCLDLCAAPGGKSTLLLNFLGESDLLVANDINRLRADTLTENISRWGSTNVITTSNQPQDFGVLKEYFDVILVDAPCSGEGLWRKTPDAVNEWSVDNVTYCSLRQKDIVRDVLPSLKVNGHLIYSTCTYNKTENEDIVNWIVSTYGLEIVHLQFPENYGLVEAQTGGFHCYPHKVAGEGFFFCVLKKPDTKVDELHEETNNNLLEYGQTMLQQEPSVNIIPHYKQKNIQHKKTAFQTLRGKTFLPQFNLQKLKQQPRFLNQWLNNKAFVWREFRGELVAIPVIHINQIQYLCEVLKVIKPGTRVGKLLRKGSEWILQPHIDLARLADSTNHSIPILSVTIEEAEDFIKNGKLNNTVVAQEAGWNLITYNGVGLGWQKLAVHSFKK